MSMEIDEMISLEREEYTFSYEVLRKFSEHGEEYLDLILAGLYTKEVETIIDIFTDNNLKLECIDILPAAYSRVLKQIEYTDIMIVDTGDYSSAIEIYKEDSLYIHDNVPVRLGDNVQEYDYMKLVDEANELMNYYSSRNFGKIVDTILLIGKHAHNNDIKNQFTRLFSSEIIQGIENLYDIYNDIKGNINEYQINRIVECLGCMLRESDKSPYYMMNLLPTEIKSQQEKKDKLLKTIKIIPIALFMLYIPVLSLSMMKKSTDNKLYEVNSEIEQIKKEPKWGDMLSDIDKNIPYKVWLENLNISYIPKELNVEENTDNSEDTNNKSNNEQNQTDDNSLKNTETPIYDKVPNFITITGSASTPTDFAKFVYNLKLLPYFEEVKFPGVTEKISGDETNKKTSYSFSITAKLKEGMITNE